MFTMKEQLRSVIEWKNDDKSIIFQEWSRTLDEIKNASKLIVAPGQAAFVVYEGKVVAHHQEPGLYELKTANIPFWTTLTKVLQQFQSEHKLAIFFYLTGEFVDLKWGTSSVVKYEDPKYKFPVGLKAFGNFSLKIADPSSFFTSIVTNSPQYTIDELRKVLVARLMQPLRDTLAESQKGYNEIDAALEEISTAVRERANQVVAALGFSLTDLRIEGTSFDEPTQTRINKIADATAEALANQALGTNYVQKEQLAALKAAAANSSGLAGLGASLSAGLQAGQMLMGGMGVGQQAGTTPAQTAAAPAQASIADKLKSLKELADAGLITAEEFAQKKAELLKQL